MSRAYRLWLLGFAVTSWACDAGTGFRVPGPSSSPARLTGRVTWPDGRPAEGASAFLVAGRQRVARVSVAQDGVFHFLEAPTGPLQVVINARRGQGHVRAVEVYGGGTNDVGELVVGPLHHWPEVFELRGVDFEERWAEREGTLHSVERYPGSDWLVGMREQPGASTEHAAGQEVVAISVQTGEERVLLDARELETRRCCWAARDGVVALEFEDDEARPVRVGVDGTRTVGAAFMLPFPHAWLGSNAGGRHGLIYVTPVTVPGRVEDPTIHQFIVLDLETLSSWSAPRHDRPTCLIPWARVDSGGRYVLDGGCFPDAQSEIRERLQLADATTLTSRSIWIGPDRTSQARHLRGFDVDSSGRVIAAIMSGERTRYFTWDSDMSPVELDLRDADGLPFSPTCPAGSRTTSLTDPCRPRFGENGRLFIDVANFDEVHQIPRWYRFEFDVGGLLLRTFELGYGSGYQPDGRLLEGPRPGDLEVWSRRGEDGFRQVLIGDADTAPEAFVQHTFLPADHDAVAVSQDGTHVYYLVPDPVTGYRQLFRTVIEAPELGDGGDG